MTKELKLHIPDSLYNTLSQTAISQSVSLEALCLSYLSEKQHLVEPSLYTSLSNGEVRLEMQKLHNSVDLPKEEVNIRLRKLERLLLRFIR